ncbi:DUF1854 domain-containing protein [Azonexus sp.]|uniref:cyanophycin metabolism-associated DUF1854 family protein n=1 Tax=Azonexus sp. TaxID=1872668 RepID=UPI0039E3143F
MNFTLQRDALHRLVLSAADGEVHIGVTPVRAFPIAAPNEGLALISGDGREIAWVDRLAELPDDTRQLIEEDLASREFVPEIEQLLNVSSFACPSAWQVRTNRGDTTLTLKGEEDIRRLAATRLLIADKNGIEYLIRDLTQLDRSSRKLLDRFL